MKRLSYLPLLAILAMLVSCDNKSKTTQSTGSYSSSALNPFMSVSTLPLQAPAFDKIKDADFKPAIEEGMQQQQAEIQRIAERSPGFRKMVG